MLTAEIASLPEDEIMAVFNTLNPTMKNWSTTTGNNNPTTNGNGVSGLEKWWVIFPLMLAIVSSLLFARGLFLHHITF
jgi:hypothetical protein